MATLRVSESKVSLTKLNSELDSELDNKNTDDIIQMINNVINEPFSCASKGEKTIGGAGIAGFFTNLFSCMTPAPPSQIEMTPISASAPTPHIETTQQPTHVIRVIPRNPESINIGIGTENIILEMDLTNITTENSANLPLTDDIWEKIYRDTLFMKEAMLLACVIKKFAKSIKDACPIDIKKIVNNTLLHSLKYVENNINDQNAHIVDLMFKLNQQSSAASSSASTSDEFYLHIFATAMKHVNEFPDITYMNEDIFIVMKLLKKTSDYQIINRDNDIILLHDTTGANNYVIKDEYPVKKKSDGTFIIQYVKDNRYTIDKSVLLTELLKKSVLTFKGTLASKDSKFIIPKFSENIVELVHIKKYSLPKNQVSSLANKERLGFLLFESYNKITNIKINYNNMTISQIKEQIKELKTDELFTNITESTFFNTITELESIKVKEFGQPAGIGGKSRRVLHRLYKNI